MKRVSGSDTSAEEMANLMIWEIVRIGQLLAGMGMSSKRKMWAPARMRDLL